MSRDERVEIARGLAAYLRHLRRYRGIHYVPRPVSDRSPAVTEVSSEKTVTSKGETTMQPAAPESPPTVSAKQALREQAQTWSAKTKLEYLQHQNLGDCRRCPLARTRQNIVFGVGSPEADLMFIGEAPGADEDRQGEPFVGRAGERLTQWIEALGMTREDVYIANVLKCRPPGNRDPRPVEVDRCSPFLRAQIRAIAPRVLVALGRHAGMLLTGREDMALKAMRQARLQYRDTKGSVSIPIIVTYHPSFILRRERESRDGGEAIERTVMSDLRRALAIAQSA